MLTEYTKKNISVYNHNFEHVRKCLPPKMAYRLASSVVNDQNIVKNLEANSLNSSIIILKSEFIFFINHVPSFFWYNN